MSERITVGITCFNAADTIERAVRSALAQDWPDIEIVVVDDVSTDGSATVVEQLAREDGRIRLIRHEANMGPGGARKTIVDEATGTFICFFDDDDESDPARLRTQHARLTSYESETGAAMTLCFASGSRVYDNGYALGMPAIGSRPEVPVGEQVADYLLFNRRIDGVFYGSGTPTCALFARRQALIDAGNFDPGQRRVEDAELAVRAARMGAHFIGCPEALFRQTATVAADKSAGRNYEAEMRMIDKNRDYLSARGRYGYAKRWYAFRYHYFRRAYAAAVATLFIAWACHPVLVTRHLLRSVPNRFRHERRMK